MTQTFVVNHDTVSGKHSSSLLLSLFFFFLFFLFFSFSLLLSSSQQAGQSLEVCPPPLSLPFQLPLTLLQTPVAPFFVPLAYALILLRADAGLPCVFYADLYGSIGQHPTPGYTNFVPPTSGGAAIPRMMLARKLWAYGPQCDYVDDDPCCVGFTRLGHSSRSAGAGLAVVMTNGWEYARKAMFVGKGHAGEVWTDVLRWCPGEVVIGADGWATFPVGHRSVAVWVHAAAQGREMVDAFVL